MHRCRRALLFRLLNLILSSITFLFLSYFKKKNLQVSNVGEGYISFRRAKGLMLDNFPMLGNIPVEGESNNHCRSTRNESRLVSSLDGPKPNPEALNGIFLAVHSPVRTSICPHVRPSVLQSVYRSPRSA